MWIFVMFRLEPHESQNGGSVGLSDIESTREGSFLVLERVNQGGLDAAIKRVYYIDLGDFSMPEGTVLEKTFWYKT